MSVEIWNWTVSMAKDKIYYFFLLIFRLAGMAASNSNITMDQSVTWLITSTICDWIGVTSNSRHVEWLPCIFQTWTFLGVPYLLNLGIYPFSFPLTLAGTISLKNCFASWLTCVDWDTLILESTILVDNFPPGLVPYRNSNTCLPKTIALWVLSHLPSVTCQTWRPYGYPSIPLTEQFQQNFRVRFSATPHFQYLLTKHFFQ